MHDELEVYGTSRHQQLGNAEVRDALLALHAVVKRTRIETLNVPFRDLDTFRTYWTRNDAKGSCKLAEIS